MSDYGDLKPTGHEIREPAATLVELTDGERWYTAIQFDATYRQMPELTTGVDLIRSFMEYPMVTGLAELWSQPTASGTFVYETGKIWTVAEILRRFRDIGQPCGVRAGLELCWLVGQILQEAGETGPREGCYSHGNLSPWRLALKGNGSAQVFGYGLPQAEWFAHLQGHPGPVEPNSLRYLPPERLDGGPEDPAADICALTLLAIEMMTGTPLYEGNDVAKLQKRISLAEGSTKLAQKKVKGLPNAVQEVFSRALIFDPDTRLSGQDYLGEIQALLKRKDVKGDGLTAVMKRMRGTDRASPKGRKLSQASTAAFTPEMLAEIAAESEAEEVAKPEDRWAKVKRDEEPVKDRRGAAKGQEPSEEKPNRRRRRTAEPESEQAPAEAPKRRRRRGGTDPVEETPVETPEPPPRRRRRSDVAEEPAETPVPETPAPDAPPKRQRRRSAPQSESPEPVEAQEEEEAPAPRRRRRSAPAEAQVEPATDDRVAPPVAADEDPPRRRRRGASEPTPEPQDDPPKDDPPRRRRRRKG